MSCPTPCRARLQGEYFTSLWALSISPWRDFSRQCNPRADSFCVCCRAQVVICSHCDRGQIYCAAGCAQAARSHSIREAGRRCQTSRRGRVAHAARNRRYRAGLQKVTHQGSPAPAPDDLLAASSTSLVEASSNAIATVRPTRQCHFCGRRCAQFVRTGPLRRRHTRRSSRPIYTTFGTTMTD